MDGMDFDAGGMMEMGDVGEMGHGGEMGLVGVLGAGLWVGNLLGRAYFGASPWNWPLGVPGGPVTGYQARQTGRAGQTGRVMTWPDVMTTAQAAAYLQVNEAEVVALLEQGGLRGRKVGDGWRVAKSVLDAWMLGDTVV